MASVVKLTVAALVVYEEAGAELFDVWHGPTSLEILRASRDTCGRPIELRLHHSAEQHVVSFVQPLPSVNR